MLCYLTSFRKHLGLQSSHHAVSLCSAQAVLAHLDIVQSIFIPSSSLDTVPCSPSQLIEEVMSPFLWI